METTTEKAVMLLITGITNFACFPALYVLYHKKMTLQFHIGVFTFVTSFLYHSLESLGWKQLYLRVGRWHMLDNIGSIMCFIILLVYFMDNLHKKDNCYASKNVCNTDINLIMIGGGVTLVMQTKHPWDLENTVCPILLFVGVLVVKLVFWRKPRVNSEYLKKGGLLMLCAVICFVRGLDDETDYLRFWHGCWHCFVGLSSFFLWQSVEKDSPLPGVNVTKFQKQPKFEFWPVLAKVLTFRFFQKTQKKPTYYKA